ncbi:hypothetical protein V1477_011658 [Vespula maculifrons]|uniref:Uncharacterized protein n=1 Tax=Vespula maculifrons TaxID=7453 RepID=A0ABD2C0H0_VESMC
MPFERILRTDFALSGDFENLSSRVDLEIFADVIRICINEDLKLRAMQSLESVFVRKVFNILTVAQTVLIKDSRVSRNKFSSQCIPEEDLDQLRCRPTSFSTNYISSTLNFDLNRGPVPQNSSKMALSYILILPCCHSKCSYIVIDTTGRVSRCLKPTVWTVEQSVSGVLYISSLLRSSKLPKRKGISNADFRVESPLARGSPDAATSTRWDLDTTGRVSRCLKPTVWTVEQSVSGVLYISSLLRSSKLPKRKGISNADFRVESPLARGSPDAATSTRWDLGRLCHLFNFCFYIHLFFYSLSVSDTTGRVSRCLKPTVWTVEQSVSGVLYISSLLRSSKLPKRKGISNADFRVESPLARGSPDAATSTRWDLDTTGRVSRCLKPTVWTVEQSVSGVLYISSLLRSSKLPKRKGISNADFRVESPLARGSPDAATSTRWDLDTTGRVSRCLKPTVWTVEQSVSGVLYISSLLRSSKLPKRKGISNANFRVESPLARGSPDAATSTRWDLGR